MQQVSLMELLGQVQELLKGDRIQDAHGLLVPALNQFPDNPALWFFYGYTMNRMGHKATAVEAWRRSYELEPQAQVLANLGAVMKDTARPEDARTVLLKAIDLNPGDVPTIANLAGSFVNEGDPRTGIELARRHGAGVEDRQFKFNLALLLLEDGQFAEGFRLYSEGFHQARDQRSYEGATRITRDNFEAARGSRLIVYGEQGIGDELMFATMLRDVAEDFEVTFDHHPRLGGLHDSSPWADKIARHPTRKSAPTWYKPGMADYFAPIGDLAQFYRSVPDTFAWRGAAYTPDPDEVATTRLYLEQMAEGRRPIGLSLRGGSLQTARTYRTIPPPLLEPLLARDDLVFVALDYDDITDIATWIGETYGPGKLLWFPSITWAWDYHHKAALVAACEAVVTVCQSVAHLSAAMGHPTHVLTPSKCAWRYGVRPGSGDPWYWYPGGHALLHRQQGEDWTPAVAEVLECLK